MAELTSKDISEEVAAAYEPLAVTVEYIEQVPALTKTTTPLVRFTVHTPSVLPIKLIVPLPAVVVAVRVGGVPEKAYKER